MISEKKNGADKFMDMIWSFSRKIFEERINNYHRKDMEFYPIWNGINYFSGATARFVRVIKLKLYTNTVVRRNGLLRDLLC